MKTVIITGANGNLGSAVTKKFLDGGYQVIATVSSNDAEASMPTHKNLDVKVVDLTKESETDLFITSVIEKYKTIDAALMLVGGFTMGNIVATTGADLHKQFALNFETAYYVTRPLFQHMLNNDSGRLVFIGARPAIEPGSGKDLLAYGLAKSLLFRLAEYLNEEARGRNIVATVVVPSTLDTPLNRKNMPETNPAKWVKPEAARRIVGIYCF